MNDNQDSNKLIKTQHYTMIRRLAGLILDIFNKKLNKENLTKLMEFKCEVIALKNINNELDNSNDELFEIILQRLIFFLVESLHKQTSSVIREMIRDIFNIEYNCQDYYLIDSIILFEGYPKIFTDKIYDQVSIKDLLNMNNIEDKELKDTAELFTIYESQYPFNKETSYEVFEKMSINNGRMKIYEGFLLWFSEYYSLYENNLKILMNEDDHIPITWKYYLAIMAVSTIKCEYMLKELEMQFLLKGGDEKWLIYGLKEVPEKLMKLDKINNILAHQPWKLKVLDLTEIHSKYESKGWHANELIHAILILTYYHRLASIVDSMRFTIRNIKQDEEKNKNLVEEQNINIITEENVEIYSNLENYHNSEKFCPKQKFQKHPIEELPKLNKSFENAPTDCKDFAKHISSFCTVYLDFDSHSEEYNSYIEYNWQDHGIYILKNFNNNGISSIDAEIEYITNISSNNIGKDPRKIDTAIYRNTICTYVEQIFGYINESFDYSITNKLLKPDHKRFIKGIACFPHKIPKKDIGELMQVTFNPEEIFHIILIATAAKMRLQLTYFSKNLYEIIKSVE